MREEKEEEASDNESFIENQNNSELEDLFPNKKMTAIDPGWRWVLAFSLVDFSNRVVFAAFGTMLGPSQPFMARNVGVDIEAITFIWTFGMRAFLLATFRDFFT